MDFIDHVPAGGDKKVLDILHVQYTYDQIVSLDFGMILYIMASVSFLDKGVCIWISVTAFNCMKFSDKDKPTKVYIVFTTITVCVYKCHIKTDIFDV